MPLIQRVLLVQQKLLITFPEHLSPHPGLSQVRVAQSLVSASESTSGFK